jgi:hypothetical protein
MSNESSVGGAGQGQDRATDHHAEHGEERALPAGEPRLVREGKKAIRRRLFRGVCLADAQWFIDHPQQPFYWRKRIAGEFEYMEPRIKDLQLYCVLVMKLGEHHHLRQAWGEGSLAAYVAGVHSRRPFISPITYENREYSSMGLGSVGTHMIGAYEADRIGVEALWHLIFEHYANMESES